MEKTICSQYQEMVDFRDTNGLTSLGICSSHTWEKDPKRLLFVLSRYKFVAKMLAGAERVLEVGCGDAFGTRIVQQHVGQVTAVDQDPVFIEDALKRRSERWPLELAVHDILSGPVQSPDVRFDAAYALDVIEHIRPVQEHRFVENIQLSMVDDGVMILGTPTAQAQKYASAQSRKGHVNCHTGRSLRVKCSRYFSHVLMFSMNDEVVHTGFAPMAHYVFAVCSGKR